MREIEIKKKEKARKIDNKLGNVCERVKETKMNFNGVWFFSRSLNVFRYVCVCVHVSVFRVAMKAIVICNKWMFVC